MFNTKRLLSVIGLPLCLGQASAAVVNSTFSMSVTEVSVGQPGNVDPTHPLLGTLGTGSFSYDADDIVTGNEVLDSTQFSLVLELFGQTFTQADDVEFPDAPTLAFAGGTPYALDFIVGELHPALPAWPNPVAIDQPGVIAIRLGDSGFGVLNEISPGVFSTAGGGLLVTPIPGALATFLSALTGIGVLAGRRRNR
ncbi:MAG: hypothetical protein KDJ39_07415 [Gammaproteobacteria bacterium]|nr:hypothetical protein [Gammaproteobacteria bacterium]MCP5298547.1 hypothetical protein [Chromatiaceae bacterium]